MKYLLYVTLILLLVPFQAVLFNRITIFGVHADLVLIAVCLIGLPAPSDQGRDTRPESPQAAL